MIRMIPIEDNPDSFTCTDLQNLLGTRTKVLDNLLPDLEQQNRGVPAHEPVPATYTG